MCFKFLLNFSRNISCRSSKHLRPASLSTKFLDDFKVFYPTIVDKTLTNYKYHNFPEVGTHCKRILEYFPICKLPIQGEILIYAYELLEERENITHEKLHQAYTVACAVEAIQSAFYIQDDVTNNRNKRAGKAAWHLLADSSNMVLNDTHTLRSFVNEMLLQNISKSIYKQIMDTLNEMYLEFEIGQFLDFSLLHSKDFSKYTSENYLQKVFLKKTYCAFNALLKLSLILSDKATEESLRLVKHMYSDLGVLIQINNEVLEYLAHSDEVPYKPCQKGIRTWPSVTALRRFNKEQKKMFMGSYGSSDPEKIERVMKLYNDRDLKNLYLLEETIRCETYLNKVRELPPYSIPSPEFFLRIFEVFQNYIYNRMSSLCNNTSHV